MKAAVITPEAAELELLEREIAAVSLVDYGQYIYPWWNPARMHALICEEFEAVYRYIESGGKEGTQALILQVVAQHGKSTIASRIFPSWVLGKLPDTRIMLSTYSADFSAEHSREVREVLNGAKFRAVFGKNSGAPIPVEISSDSFAKGNWSLASPYRGGMLAIGVEGGATGHPAGLIIIDDPFKNREETDSPRERQKKLKWYTSSILTRVKKNTAIVIIHTRWHREDLIGEALKSMAKDLKAIQFRVVSIPALPLELEDYATSNEDQREAALQGIYRPFVDDLGRTPGSHEAAWPEEFPAFTLLKMQATLQANGQMGDWHSLYQQNPRPEDGVFFGHTMFKRIKKAPDNLQWYGYMDLAMGESEQSDWNACGIVAFDAEQNFYIRDLVHVHDLDSFLDEMILIMTSKLEIGTVWGVESVAFQKRIYQEFMKNEKLRGAAIEPINVDKDKVTRARPIRSRGLAGKLFLVDGPWVEGFLEEAFDFPTGKHDDRVDTISGGLAMADEGAILGSGPLVM